jgi:HEAT repeat protein
MESLQVLEKLKDAIRTDDVNKTLDILSKINEDNLNDQDITDLIVKLFGSKHWLLRNKASIKLVDSKSEKALNSLRNALCSENNDIEYWCINSLGLLNDSYSIDILKSKFASENINSDFAALAVARIGDMSGVKYLFKKLASDVFAERERAAGCLEYVADKISKALVSAMGYTHEEIRFWCKRILIRATISKPEEIVPYLKNANVHIRRGLAQILGKYNSDLIIKSLIERFSDPDWKVRFYSYESISKIGISAVPELKINSGSDNPDQSYWSLRSLGTIGGEDAVDYLITSLKDPSSYVRKHTARYIGHTKSAKAVEPLLMSLGDKSFSVRKSAASSLIEYGEEIIESIASFLDSSNEDIGFSLTMVFGAIKGKKAIRYLSEAMMSDNKIKRKWAALSLGMVKDVSVCNILVQGLKDSYWPVRNNCAQSLEMYCPECLEVLIQNIQNEDPDICFWITKVMQRVKDKIWDKLKFYLSMGNEELRFFTAFAFGEIGDPSAAPVLISALEDGNDWVRKLALESLIKLDCIEELTNKMKTSPPAMKNEIADKLRAIGKIKIEDIIDDLVSENKEIKKAAMMSIFKMGKPVVSKLREIMENTENENLRMVLIKLCRSIETDSEFGLDF